MEYPVKFICRTCEKANKNPNIPNFVNFKYESLTDIIEHMLNFEKEEDSIHHVEAIIELDLP